MTETILCANGRMAVKYAMVRALKDGISCGQRFIPYKRIAGCDFRVVGRKVGDDVEAFAQVGLGVVVDLGCPDDLRAIRQIADVQVTDFQRKLAGLRKIEEIGRGGERAVDQILRDPVIGDDQEPCIGACIGNFAGKTSLGHWAFPQENRRYRALESVLYA